MWLMDEVDAELIRKAVDDASPIVVCSGCGARAVRLDDGALINPGPGSMLSLCVTRPGRLRPHGPWVPERVSA